MGMEIKPRTRVKAEDLQVGQTLAIAADDIAFRYVNRVMKLDDHHVIIVPERGDPIVRQNNDLVWVN